MKFRAHKRLFRALGTLLFIENLGTCRLALKLEGTQPCTTFKNESDFDVQDHNHEK